VFAREGGDKQLAGDRAGIPFTVRGVRLGHIAVVQTQSSTVLNNVLRQGAENPADCLPSSVKVSAKPLPAYESRTSHRFRFNLSRWKGIDLAPIPTTDWSDECSRETEKIDLR